MGKIEPWLVMRQSCPQTPSYPRYTTSHKNRLQIADYQNDGSFASFQRTPTVYELCTNCCYTAVETANKGRNVSHCSCKTGFSLENVCGPTGSWTQHSQECLQRIFSTTELLNTYHHRMMQLFSKCIWTSTFICTWLSKKVNDCDLFYLKYN